MVDKKRPLASKVLAYTSASACIITGIFYGATYAPTSTRLNSQAQAIDRPIESVATNFVALLLDDDETIREEAFAQLQRLEPSDAVTYLVEATKDPDWRVRTIAVHTLGRLGKVADDAIPTVIEVAQADENSNVRFAATKALGEFGSISVEPVLIEALEDPDENIRLAATQALSELAPRAKNAFPALARVSWDGNWMVRNQANKALTKLDPYVIDYAALFEESDFSSSRNMLGEVISGELLIKNGDVSTPEIIEIYVRDSDIYSSHRIFIANVLGEIGSEEAKQFLLKALVSEELYNYAIAVAIGSLDPEAAITALATDLQNPDPDKQLDAVNKISLINSDASLPYLEDALIYGDEIIQERVVEVIAELPMNTPSILDLVDKIDTGDIREREEAIESLLLFINNISRTVPNNLRYSGNYEIIISVLVNSLDDESDFVRFTALDALASIDELFVGSSYNEGRKGYSGDQKFDRLVEEDIPIGIDAYITLLINFLSDHPESESTQQFDGIAENVQTLLSALNPESQKYALPLILEKLEVEDKQTTLNAIVALGGVDSEESISHLEKIFITGDFEVREKVIQALEAINSSTSVEALLIALFDSDFEKAHHYETRSSAIRTLNRLSPTIEVVPIEVDAEALYENLIDYDFDDGFRFWAATTVNQLDANRKERVISLLNNSFVSSEIDDKYWVSEALGKIEGAPIIAVPALVSQLRSTDDLQRYDAISFLGAIGPQAAAAIPEIKTFLESEDQVFRYGAALALAQIQASPDCFMQVLNEGLLEGELDFESLASILGRNGSYEAIELLIDSFEENVLVNPYEPYVTRCGMPNAVFELTPLGEKAVPSLIEGLKNPSARFSVAETLGQIGDEAEPELLEILASSSDVPVALQEVLQDQDQDIRRSAAFALRRVRNPSKNAIRALIQVVENPEDHIEVRWMAAAALQYHGIDMQEFFISEKQPNPLTHTCASTLYLRRWFSTFDVYQKRCLHIDFGGCGDGFQTLYGRLRELLTNRSSNQD